MSFQDHLDLSLYTAIKVPFYHITVSDQLKKIHSVHETETNQLAWKKKYLPWTFFVGWKIPQHHPFRKLAREISFLKKMDEINIEFSFKISFKKPTQYIQNFKLSSCPTWSEYRFFKSLSHTLSSPVCGPGWSFIQVGFWQAPHLAQMNSSPILS